MSRVTAISNLGTDLQFGSLTEGPVIGTEFPNPCGWTGGIRCAISEAQSNHFLPFPVYVLDDIVSTA
jgi:hypothetical protein